MDRDIHGCIWVYVGIYTDGGPDIKHPPPLIFSMAPNIYRVF